MIKNKIGRRDFAATVGLGTAGLVATGMAGAARGYPANETLNVGCIGTGGRCRMLMRTLEKMPDVRMTAVCDIWDDNLERAKKIAGPKAFSTKYYQEVLDRKDVDAVLIGSPDHWHVPMTVDACEAGKDVYVEKPLTHNLSEGVAVIEAERKHKRIVQVGMQQRSMPQFQEGFKMIQSGEIGPVHKVHLTWNRNLPAWFRTSVNEVDPRGVDWKRFLGSAKDQPFDSFRFRKWRWFWDFGGGILTDLMVHYIDVANWFLDLGNPALATTIGDNFITKGVWETPDTIQTLLQYPEKEVQIYFEGTFVSARNRAMIEFMGRDATLYVDRGRYEVHPEPGRKAEHRQRIYGDKPRGNDFDSNPDGELLHLTNWIECVRSRKTPNAPAEAGVRAVEGAHLGNRAFRTGKVARW